MIKKTFNNLIRTLTVLAPIAVYSLFIGAFSTTCIGLYFDLDFFPENIFYILSIIFYFVLYFILQCPNLIESLMDSAFHAGLSGLFLGFFSYQVFNHIDWFAALITIWQYKVICYLAVSFLQAISLVAAKEWLSKQKVKRLKLS